MSDAKKSGKRRRYVTAFWDDTAPEEPLSIEVVIEDSDPVFTGLLDASGQKLFRVSDRAPMGFEIPGGPENV